MCCDRRRLSMTPRTSRSFGPRKPVLTPRWLGILCVAGWRTFTGEPRFPERPTTATSRLWQQRASPPPLAEEAVKVCRPLRRDQRRHRALNPFEAADAQLLAAVNRGEWALKGFRNRDIRALLFDQTNDKRQQRSQAAKVSRRLALLHAHGLIAKVSRTYRWQVTKKGHRILTALLAARQADTDKLISLAA